MTNSLCDRKGLLPKKGNKGLFSFGIAAHTVLKFINIAKFLVYPRKYLHLSHIVIYHQFKLLNTFIVCGLYLHDNTFGQIIKCNWLKYQIHCDKQYLPYVGQYTCTTDILCKPKVARGLLV